MPEAGVTHDITIEQSDGTVRGFMVSRDASAKTQNFSITEASPFATRISDKTGYASQDPTVDLVHVKSDWSGGMGQERIEDNKTDQYLDSENIDTRYKGRIMLGPFLFASYVGTGGPGSNVLGEMCGYQSFVPFNGAFYAISSHTDGVTGATYVYKYDPLNSQFDEVLKDDTVCAAPAGLLVFGEYIIAVMGTLFYISEDGDDWGESLAMNANFMQVVNGVLYAAWGNGVSGTDDPSGVWTSPPAEIGDSCYDINHLYEIENILYIGKDDGLWSYDENGNVLNLLPEYRQTPATENMKYGTVFKNKGVFSTFQDGAVLYESPGLSDISPSFGNAPTYVSGYPMRGMCNGVDFVYCTVLVESDYIVILAGKLRNTGGNLEWVWHPVYYGLPLGEAGGSYDAMAYAGSDSDWNDGDGAMFEDPNPRLWIGRSDETLLPGFFLMPRGHNTPDQDGVCRFQSWDENPITTFGVLVEPELDFDYPDEDKCYNYISVETEGCDPGPGDGTAMCEVVVDYILDGDPASLGSLGPITTNGVTNLSFPSGCYGKKIQLLIKLGNNKGNEYTPVVRKYELHCMLRPTRRRKFDFGVRCAGGLMGFNGTIPLEETAADIIGWLDDIRAEKTPVVLTTVDGVEYNIVIQSLAYTTLYDRESQHTETICAVSAIEDVSSYKVDENSSVVPTPSTPPVYTDYVVTIKEAVARGQVIHQDTDGWYVASCDDGAGGSTARLALASEDGEADDSIHVCTFGDMGGLSHGVTTGYPVYLSTDGGMSANPPDTIGYTVRVIGYATSASDIAFHPDNAWAIVGGVS